MRLSRLTRVFSCILAAELLCLQAPSNAAATESFATIDAASVAEVIEGTEAEGASNVITDSEVTEVDGTISSEEAFADAAENEAVVAPGIEVGVLDDGTVVTEGNSDSGEATNGQENRVELNSGAQRSSNFISVDDTFTTSDGTFELVMGGLKEENRKAVIEALEKYYVVGSQTPLILVDEAFPDAEKYDNQPDVNRLTGDGFFDSMHCWAASTSNILWVSGWAPQILNPKTGKPFSSEDDVFEYFNASFSDAGSECKSGIDWFFMGEYFLLSYGGDAHLFKPKNPDDGLMKDFVSTLVQEGIILAEPASGHPELIEELLRTGSSTERPAMFEASIGSLNMGVIKASSHSVTAVGVIVDPNATELANRFKAIALIDSDNDAVPSAAMGKGSDTYGYGPSVEVKNADKEARPNTVSFYGLELIEDREGTPCWKLIGYSMDADGYEDGNPCILYKMTALPLYDERLLEFCSESANGGGTTAVADSVDLMIETAYTTDETEPITNLYGFNAREHTVTEFLQGDPISLNYLVQNRSNVVLTEEYAGRSWFTVDWKVVRDSDGVVVAQGQSVCELPEHWHSQANYVTALNADGDEVAIWKPGAYTAVLEVNADRSIVEAYYLNNLPVEVRFVVTPSGDQEPEDNPDELPDTPDQPDTDGGGAPDSGTNNENYPGQTTDNDSGTLISCVRNEVWAAPVSKVTGHTLAQTGDKNAIYLQIAANLTTVAIILLIGSMVVRARGQVYKS